MTKETIITIPTTPKQLRRIAQDMEDHMEKAKLGQWLYSYSFYMGTELTVKLQADQDAWHRRSESQWT